MKIRLIALDLDGTLLTTEKELTKRSVDALTMAAAKGIHIVPATGRSVTGLARKVRDLPFVRYAISVNGAAVWDLKTENKIVEKIFLPEQAEEVWKTAEQFQTMQDACIDGVCRISPEYYNALERYMPDAPRIRLIRQTRHPEDNLRSMVLDPQSKVEKINLYFREDQETERQHARRILEKLPYTAVTTSLGNNLEINHAEATKGNALLALAEYLGIPREETMAFGDGGNDLSMIRCAGVGVAMANALPEVLQAADRITGSNDEDGVACAIEEWVLKE